MRLSKLFFIICFLSACAAQRPIEVESSMPAPAPVPKVKASAPIVIAPAPEVEAYEQAPPSKSENSVYPSFVTKKEKKDFIYHVFYGTSRNIVARKKDMVVYGNERDAGIHYGVGEVHIPEHHQPGSVGSFLGTVFGYDPILKVVSVKEFISSNNFFDNVKNELGKNAPDKKNLLIFIHGYNNKFEEALIRTAQVGVDVGVEDYHTFMFSWASKGEPSGYLVDEATVDASEIFLEEFLTSVIKNIPRDYRVSIIAHSMGNRALLRVTNQAIQQVAKKEKYKFWQIFLAAPDVDIDVFKQLASAYKDMASKTTIYTSPADNAVHLSQELHYYPRVGYLKSDTKPLRINDIDVIKVKNQCVDLMGHAYFAEAAPVLNDIHELIHNGTSSRKDELGWIKVDYYWTLDSPGNCN